MKLQTIFGGEQIGAPPARVKTLLPRTKRKFSSLFLEFINELPTPFRTQRERPPDELVNARGQRKRNKSFKLKIIAEQELVGR